ncbi:CNH domain-domain-containing protein [Microdochium bolleyi]|uniref:CNH domain-domain-containing protein n=1 Tax=Microdochium bolleyi TaxID=196109 RepID=A0A136J9N8_9PEZI|nr:CNH domain-domain-containing protein [Microdochium bolleyi]
MAEYQYDQRRYGPAPGNQRDAVFNDIFGAAPPGGRSTTMSSASTGNMPQPHTGGHDGRTNTMSSMASSSAGYPEMQRRPPPRMPPPGAPRGGYGDPMAQRTRTMDTSMTNGYYQSQRHPSGGYPPPLPGQHQRQPPPGPDRRPYPGPPPQGQPRYESRDGVPAGYPPRGPPPPHPQQRFHQPQPGSGASLRDDPYRSQSMASLPRQPTYQQPSGQYQAAQPNFRQGPAPAPSSRTTAQGRVVPERHDDRSMSMTGYPPDRDPSHHSSHQTMSGRVIPNRARAPSNEGPGMNGYANYNGHASTPGSATRTMSMASSTMASSTAGGDHSRTMSMASTIAPSEIGRQPLMHRPSVASQKSAEGDRPPTGKIRAPLVNPAFLSKVAECFQRKIITGERTKNGLTYKNAFSGSEAVDVLSYIIRTTDRNLALLLGRALDAQKFFHDVTYEHRLRDSTSEMYQFRETLMDEPEDKTAVNGVFVLLSECYSPTCTRDQLCYSIACPRRLEQVARLNLKPQVGLKKDQDAALNDDLDQTDEQKLWINTVPKAIAESVDDREKKRQEVISEICYTERDFVKDLEYLRDFWILPLRSQGSPIPAQRRDRVVRQIFSNVIDHPSVHSVSSRFARALTERQQKDHVVRNIGDIFLEIVPQFEPFILYGSKQLEAKFSFENERSANPYFAKFVEEIERRKESRKLELNGYLTKPTTRLARYPLLLENVLKNTEDGNPDKEDIPKVLTTIRELLTRVNAESGKAENRFNLRRLNEQLRFRPADRVDLKLTEDGRELVFKTNFKKTLTDPTDITAFLFDHAVLLVRIKQVGKGQEEVKAYRRPIPLELLSIREMAEVIPQQGMKRSSSSLPSFRSKESDKKLAEGWPITFRHLGRNFYEQILYASNQSARKKWLEYIDTAQQRLRARADFFNVNTLSSGFFQAGNFVNTVTPFDGGRKLIYGTDNGIYVSVRKNKDQPPKRVIEAQNVTQVDLLEEYGLLLVLSNKSLLSYSMAALDPNEPTLSKRPKKIQSHCNFFKTGICLGRHLVCCVKSSALSTTIKVYEPNDSMSKGKKQKGFGKMFNAGQDELKAFKEFYIPTESTSVHFLKSKLCVACARGFEVVSLETLETQSLLDQADTSLDFVARKEGVKPIHIERLNGEFLLNYTDFSFFVNRNGWRARPEWRIDWEGVPQSFALSYPWILAFEPNFIELRNIESGAVHIVPHKNIRMLHSSTHEILFAYEDENGQDVVAAIDFWKNNRRSELITQEKA